jgi:hypothetical protein
MTTLNPNLPYIYYQWPDNAALSLIRRRRLYQSLFATTPLHDQGLIWSAISREVVQLHPYFVVTDRQCRNKWNSLKSGYENLERLINGNPNEYNTRTPTLHDERFHDELSDQFWLTERNYLLFT